VRPLLERTLVLSGAWRIASRVRPHRRSAHRLLGLRHEGRVGEGLFGELRSRLVPIVRAITSRPSPTTPACASRRPRPTAGVRLSVIRRFGYDFGRGRQDKTHHPFMTKFSLGDVRITTRVREDEITDALFSTLHECGHALYEHGHRRAYEGTPLASGTSSGVHESQSRLWENLVGRSLGFWEHFYPVLQKAFPDSCSRAAGHVLPRGQPRRALAHPHDSDEVTYNLHVMLRLRARTRPARGQARREGPGARVARAVRGRPGMAVPDDRNGVLQDVHWYAARSAARSRATRSATSCRRSSSIARCARTRVFPPMSARRVHGVAGWLKENIYRHGAKFTAPELIQRVTGGPLQLEPYLDYLWGKFQPLYGLRDQERQAAGVA
jgi:carboxypeptidase Taq